MQQELIINILGKDKLGILSSITSCISANACNILDSRHAIYGTDFSVSMIVSGKESSITRLEVAMSSLCVEQELLCMMKRTSGHIKQNLEQLVSLKFQGNDAEGLLQKVTEYLSAHSVSISALRLKTINGPDGFTLECKMILSAPADLNLSEFDTKIRQQLHDIGLSGQISHQISREDNEYIESW